MYFKGFELTLNVKDVRSTIDHCRFNGIEFSYFDERENITIQFAEFKYVVSFLKKTSGLWVGYICPFICLLY